MFFAMSVNKQSLDLRDLKENDQTGENLIPRIGKDLLDIGSIFDQTSKDIERKLQDFFCISKDHQIITFLARFSEKKLYVIKKGDNVIFEHVIENEGRAYENTTGIFTVPMDGLYSFSATIRQGIIDTLSSKYVHAALCRNNIPMAMSAAKNFNSLTISVSLRLKQGDQICIKSTDFDAGITGYGQSFFSGHLVHRIRQRSRHEDLEQH